LYPAVALIWGLAYPSTNLTSERDKIVVRLLLARHGETEWTREGRYQGTTDTALTGNGRAQAEALARRLAGERLTAIFASELQRALNTAAPIAKTHGQKVCPEPRLREIGFGIWEGLTWAQIAQQDTDTWARWVANPMSAMPAGGESLSSIANRLRHLLADLAARPDDETILLVAHGGSLRVLICLALGLPPGLAWSLRMDNGALSELYLSPDTGAGHKAILSLLNDRHHLNGHADIA
jgi:broad specificity phosphatase PhoE